MRVGPAETRDRSKVINAAFAGLLNKISSKRDGGIGEVNTSVMLLNQWQKRKNAVEHFLGLNDHFLFTYLD